MPSSKRIQFDKIKREHKMALLSFIRDSTKNGQSPRSISQAFRAILFEETGAPKRMDTLQLSPSQYRTLVNEHKDVIEDLYARISQGSTNSIGCCLSTASASSTRPKVAITVINRCTVPFSLPSNFTQAAVALLKFDHIPTYENMEVSHRCHNAHCFNHDHLIWESVNDNAKRKICQVKGKCVCGLEDRCIFG